MELKHIDIARLSISSANMRGQKKAPDLTNILPSIRARGILVPLIVRQNGSPETYEIVAGKRRYHAALTIAQWGHAHRSDKPRPDNGGFTLEEVRPLLRALLDRVHDITGHRRPNGWRREQREMLS